MKFSKCLLMLPFAIMATGCSDKDIEFVENENLDNQTKSVVLKGQTWNVGDTIRYCFLNGTEEQKATYRQCIDSYKGVANIYFIESRRGSRADLRISFDGSPRPTNNDTRWWEFSRSVLGKEAVKKTIDQSTPNFYVFYNHSVSKAEMERGILHELGHVLGLVDEHVHPSFPYKFNFEKIQNDLIDGRTQEQSDYLFSQLFYHKVVYSLLKKLFITETYDESSIMMPHFNEKYINAGYTIWGGCYLSSGDKERLRKLYPFKREDIIPIYVSSFKEDHAHLSNCQDGGFYRKLVGYGYSTQKTNTYPLCKYVNNKTGEIRYALKKGNTYTSGVDDANWTVRTFVAYVYDREGAGRTPLCQYNYKNSNTYAGLSYANDQYMIGLGTVILPYCWASVLTDPNN